MDNLIRLVEGMSFWGWMAVIAIGAIAIDGILKLKRMQIKHAERIAKIKQGIDPGDETEAYKKDEL